jgi:hypothetical protein
MYGYISVRRPIAIESLELSRCPGRRPPPAPNLPAARTVGSGVPCAGVSSETPGGRSRRSAPTGSTETYKPGHESGDAGRAQSETGDTLVRTVRRD